MTASICGLIASPFMLLSHPISHLSATSDLARNASFPYAVCGLIILLISCLSIFFLRRPKKPVIFKNQNRKMSRYAIASIILGIPFLGLLTWGTISLAGIIFGILALHQISNSEKLKGKRVAMIGICLSFTIFPLLITMLLFLGP